MPRARFGTTLRGLGGHRDERGDPDPERICTSHIERQNLSMRMGIRRLTRLTNAFSKKLANHKAAIAVVAKVG